MTDSWDLAKQLADKHENQGSIFVRLTSNGEKIVGAFCGEPFAREMHWMGDRYDECAGDPCPACKTGVRTTLRVMLNFFVPTEGGMKVIEGGVTWFKDVLKVKEKYGLGSWLFEIERHGEPGDPKTKYTILPEQKIEPDLRAAIQSAELHDLKQISQGEEQSSEEPTPARTAAVDPQVAAEIVAKLKQLPRAQVDEFLTEFKITRIRELTAQSAPNAIAWADTRLAELPKTTASDTDPWEY